MGLRQRDPERPAQAGDLLALEALDESGLAVTREGAFVRVLRVSAPNPLVMDDEERDATVLTFARLLGRLEAGQSLQLYVESRPAPLDGLLAELLARVEHASRTADHRHEQGRWREELYAGCEESLRLHADDLAAAQLNAYVVVPYIPRVRLGGGGRDLLAQLRGVRSRSAPLRRSPREHRRVERESLQHTDMLRAEVEMLGRPASLLNGEEFAALLWSRFNPTSADDARLGELSLGPEVLGSLDSTRDRETAREAARRLREHIARSPIDFNASDWYAVVEHDLEQTVYAEKTADVTFLGWLLGAMQTRQPFTLSMHVHALDRGHERQRQKLDYRRIYGINRGSEMRGRVPDFDRLLQEDEKRALLEDMSSGDRTGLYSVSLYFSTRASGPQPSIDELRLGVDYVVEQIAAASDIGCNRGWKQQPELWPATLPLGRDLARRTRRYATRNVAESVPLVGTSCGSPGGFPLGFSEPGRVIERLDPYDREHDNFTMLINGKSGVGKTLVAIVILLRCLMLGARGFVLDRAGHYEPATRMIPGARHLRIGSGEDGFAVNPWDVDDSASVSLEKVAFLVSLHVMLVGQPKAAGVDVSALERNLLDGAIRAVYRRGAEEGFDPLERHLRDELRARAERERDAGAQEVAVTLRSLAERLESFCDEGSYAYLLDRPTSVTAEAPLLVFDTRSVPEIVLRPVIFCLLEYIVREVERGRADAAERLEADGSLRDLTGFSVALIDEGWRIVGDPEIGEYANDLARRARHLALFLLVITQALSDLDTEHGRALIANSTILLLLKQAVEELAYLKDAKRLADSEVEIISRLRTKKGSYSEAYLINGSRGRGQISLRFGPFEYWIATSDPVHDAPLRAAALAQAGGDMVEAIWLLANDQVSAGAAGEPPVEVEV